MSYDARDYEKVCDNVYQQDYCSNDSNTISFRISVAGFFAQGFGPKSPDPFHDPQSMRHGHCDNVLVLQSS